MSSGKWRPSCLGLNVLRGIIAGGRTTFEIKERDTHLPYEIFINHVSSVSHMVPGSHFGNVEFKTWFVDDLFIQYDDNDIDYDFMNDKVWDQYQKRCHSDNGSYWSLDTS